MHAIDGWYGGGMMFVWLILLVVIVAAAVLFARGLRRGGGGPEGPEETLKRRFANGEIDEDEYRRKLDLLRGRSD